MTDFIKDKGIDFGEGYNNFTDLINAASKSNSYFMEMEKIDMKDMYQNINIETRKLNESLNGSVKVKLLTKAMYIAAVFVLALSTWFFVSLFINQKQSTFRLVALTTHQEAVLPDGTFVLLNKGSEIQYRKFNKQHKHEVALKGEAFFKVIKKEQEKFCVNVEHVVIEVVGTSFNVKQFENGNVRVDVSHGIVSLVAENSNANKFIYAGQFGIFNAKNGSVKVDTNSLLENDLSKDAQLIFKNASLQSVFATLEQVFGVQIKVNNREILHYTFTSNCNNQSLKEILKELEILHKIEYKFLNDVVYIE